jgi:hypothetical protein
MMKRLAVVLLIFGLTVPAAWGQPVSWKKQARDLQPISNIVSNQVQVLDATDDAVWIGPLLTVYREGTDTLQIADESALNESENVVFALEAQIVSPSRSLVWAGLAFDTGGNVPGAGGFLVSTDGGETFTETPPQLDEPSDTTIRYGASTLPAAAITQQANSAPQDLAFDPTADTVWVAGVRSGIRWTTDQGQSWNRTVLPPDTSQSVGPTTSTDFFVGPREQGEDGRGFLNHIGFSVLVDETGTVWAGTAKGLNRSRPENVTAGGDRAWRRFGVADSLNTPPGEFVVDLAEQPRSGARNPVWIAAWAGQQQQQGRLQRFGLAVTSDGGETFRQTLLGERISEVAARAERVYAAGDQELFVSDDQGRTWRSIEDFPVENEDRVLPPEVTPQAVAVTDAALWLGTSDGLLRLDRSKEPRLLTGSPEWRLFRAETPVNPEQPTERVPDVSTYAYPNPFVPSRDQIVRFAYELQEARTVTVTIYDFAMNRVRTITKQKSAGQQETVWDGTDDQGLRVPTGTYFYRVEFGGNAVQGKVLVAN